MLKLKILFLLVKIFRKEKTHFIIKSTNYTFHSESKNCIHIINFNIFRILNKIKNYIVLKLAGVNNYNSLIIILNQKCLVLYINTQ